MKYFLPIFVGLTITLTGGVLLASAQGYQPLVNLPGVTTVGTAVGMGEYLAGMMKFIVAIAGVFAIIVAIIGGTQYVAAGIAPSAKEDAKGRIMNAFIGLALVLTSYLILNSINPKLVAFNLSLDPITGPAAVTDPDAAGSVVPPVGVCPPWYFALTPLDADASAMESGPAVIWASTIDTNINQNLDKLKNMVVALNASLPTGASATVNSAYRPFSYQKHLWEIWVNWKFRGLEFNNNPACATLKGQIGTEYSKHGLGDVVATPTKCGSPHVLGIGVDITLVGFPYASVNALLSSKNIDLSWSGLKGDKWHFVLKNRPYTGCAL